MKQQLDSRAMHPSARQALKPALEVVTAFTAVVEPGQGQRDRADFFWAQLETVLDDTSGSRDRAFIQAELIVGLVQLSALLAEDAAGRDETSVPDVLRRIGLSSQ